MYLNMVYGRSVFSQEVKMSISAGFFLQEFDSTKSCFFMLYKKKFSAGKMDNPRELSGRIKCQFAKHNIWYNQNQ